MYLKVSKAPPKFFQCYTNEKGHSQLGVALPYVFCKVSHRGEDKSLTSLLEVNACPVNTPVGNNSLSFARRTLQLAHVLDALLRKQVVVTVCD